MIRLNVEDIRNEFRSLLASEQIVTNGNITGSESIEILNASFVADEDTIFGKVNDDWNEREYSWYLSMSLNVNDIPPPVPEIWKRVASKDGLINSNYGYLVDSHQNHSQFYHCLHQLLRDRGTRRACIIYTRPSIQVEYNRDGMSDFICTETVQYFIRDNKLITVVKMRSSDAVYGYKGDLFWQKKVRDSLIEQYNLWQHDSQRISAGEIYWNAGSLHIYKRHFNLVK